MYDHMFMTLRVKPASDGASDLGTSLTLGNAQAELNQESEDGWEVVGITPYEEDFILVLLRRPKPT